MRHSPSIIWQGQQGTLHFWNYYSKKTPINRSAAGLIQHPNFPIRGPAIVTTGTSNWNHVRVGGAIDETKERIGDLGFAGEILLKPSGRWKTHTNIYVTDQKDLLLLKLALHRGL